MTFHTACPMGAIPMRNKMLALNKPYTKGGGGLDQKNLHLITLLGSSAVGGEILVGSNAFWVPALIILQFPRKRRRYYLGLG